MLFRCIFEALRLNALIRLLVIGRIVVCKPNRVS